MDYKLNLKIKVPSLPNFLKCETVIGGKKEEITISVADLTYPQIEELGKEWINAMKKHSLSMMERHKNVCEE